MYQLWQYTDEAGNMALSGMYVFRDKSGWFCVMGKTIPNAFNNCKQQKFISSKVELGKTLLIDNIKSLDSFMDEFPELFI